jgi:hypothetical protein
MRAVCCAHIIRPYLMNLIIFGEEHKWQSSSLCNTLPPPVTPPLISPNKYSRQRPFSDTLSPCSSLIVSEWDVMLKVTCSFRCVIITPRRRRRDRGCKTLRILYFGARWMWVASFAFRHPYPDTQ